MQIPQTKPSIFWGEIAPADHLVQFYEDDVAILDSLYSFVGGGIRVGESVVMIMTPGRSSALNARLANSGFDLKWLQARDQYIALDAEEVLGSFMVEGWPDDELFERAITGVLARARHGGRRVRAFGEMVAILWARGDNAATVRLEHLWQVPCKKEQLPLFCAYPKSGFTQDAATSVRHICEAHSRLVAA